jgi:hypothetical protein
MELVGVGFGFRCQRLTECRAGLCAGRRIQVGTGARPAFLRSEIRLLTREF